MKRNINKSEERVIEDVPDKEYTIMSSSDFSEDDEQIPLVKLYVKDDGDIEVEAMSDSPFDQESKKMAMGSVKSTANKPLKDRLKRIDKTLNHSDPFFSTELQRQNIIGNKGNKKQSIQSVIGEDPKNVSDEPVENNDNSKDLTNKYIDTLAAQILATNRDDLKAAANLKSATEEKLVDLFKDITGVDYYTEEIVDEDQYNYLLDLLGRSHNKYDDSYVSPKWNSYVMKLKDLTEDLIEKAILKNDPDFYKLDD